METDELQYELPAELIAQRPADCRSDSKLLVFDRCKNSLADSRFSQIGRFLSEGDCLVLNDTKVIPARFFARRLSGGRIEGLFLSEPDFGIWEVMLKGAGRVKPAETIQLTDTGKRIFCRAVVIKKSGRGFYRLKVDADTDADGVLEQIGYPPLPPYIKRDDDAVLAQKDRLRYQTVFARHKGAVAAPTAGLHFTKELISELENAGIHLAYITLQVGLGTFKPIDTGNIEDFEIDPEKFSISEQSIRVINSARQKGGRIIAVGTTSVRSLETAAQDGRIRAVSGTTELFIKPGYKFKIVDAVVTNFHLPGTSLLALVVAFAGLEQVIGAYNYAVQKRYRFYSYGDAMLIL